MAKKMNWSIWAWKVATTTTTVLLAGGVSVWQDNPYWLALVPILQAIQNYLKHR